MAPGLIILSVVLGLLPSTGLWLAGWALVSEYPNFDETLLLILSGIGLYSAWHLVFRYKRYVEKTMPIWLKSGLLIGLISWVLIIFRFAPFDSVGEMLLVIHLFGGGVLVTVAICLAAIWSGRQDKHIEASF